VRRLLLPLTSAALTGLLWTSASPLHACVCVGEPLDTYVSHASTIAVAIVKAEIITPPLDRNVPDTLIHSLAYDLDVEEYLKGIGPMIITVSEPSITYQFNDAGQLTSSINDCVTFLPGVPSGTRYLLFLSGNASPFTSPGACSGSTSLMDYPGNDYMLRVRAAVAALPAGGGPPASTNFPLLLAAVAATLGPLAFLAGAAFVFRRT
jgi:hypothetical protein